MALQNFYAISSRDIEREIFPMALSENISIMPGSPLAGGFLSGKYTGNNEVAGDSRRDTFDFPLVNKEKTYDIIDVMAKIAAAHHVSVASLALNWVTRQPGVTSTIIGAKKIAQLKDSLSSVDLQLSHEEIQQLSEISALASEYPGWMVARQAQGRWPE